jgi:hypothetical protein
MDDLKECREAFEAWVSKECDFCLDWHGGDPFDHGHTMDAWAAWQAALNRRAVPQANAEQDALRYRTMKENDLTAEYCEYINDCLNERETIDLDVLVDRAASKTTPSSGEGG